MGASKHIGPAPGASERPAIEFREAAGALMPFVAPYYLYRFDAARIEGVDRVDMGQIRFMLEGSGVRIFADGHAEPSCPVMINGPGTAATSYCVEGPFRCFGVSLRAIGWKALIGLPAHKVANRVLDGAELFGPEALDLLGRLRALDRIEDMIAEVEPFLRARLRPVPPAHVALARAVREWTASGEPGVEALYARLDMSDRQATRLCNEYFGGPPKHLERKYRAIRAAMRIYQGASNADAAEAFSDQSHMIKDVKHFTGHTPTSLREGIDPVLAITLDNETFHFMPEVIPEAVDLSGD